MVSRATGGASLRRRAVILRQPGVALTGTFNEIKEYDSAVSRRRDPHMYDKEWRMGTSDLLHGGETLTTEFTSHLNDRDLIKASGSVCSSAWSTALNCDWSASAVAPSTCGVERSRACLESTVG